MKKVLSDTKGKMQNLILSVYMGGYGPVEGNMVVTNTSIQ